MSFVSSEHAVSYVRDLEGASIKSNTAETPMVKQQLAKFRNKLKNTAIVDILENLLSFNPYFRKTPLEIAQNNTIFDDVRDT